MVRKNLGRILLVRDQQEQPFVQVNADRSIWIKWQRVAAISTGWRKMLMSFWSRTGQIAWRFSLLDCVAATVKTAASTKLPTTPAALGYWSTGDRDRMSTRLVQLGGSSRKARVAAANSGEMKML